MLAICSQGPRLAGNLHGNPECHLNVWGGGQMGRKGMGCSVLVGICCRRLPQQIFCKMLPPPPPSTPTLLYMYCTVSWHSRFSYRFSARRGLLPPNYLQGWASRCRISHAKRVLPPHTPPTFSGLPCEFPARRVPQNCISVLPASPPT